MPKGKPAASKPEPVDTNMDDDTINLDAFPTPDSNQENAGSARNKDRSGKATAKKSVKSKAVGRRASSDSILPKKAIAKKKTVAKRAPLKEKTSIR